jgi:hypothetical protein
MEKFIIAGIVQLMFFASSQANMCPGAFVSTSNGTVCMDGLNATEIFDLGIDPDGAGVLPTTYYRVEFDWKDPVGTTPDPRDAFLGDDAGAEAAAIAIATALDETTAVTVGTGFGGGSEQFSVPVPPAALLFASGLGMLGWVRRCGRRLPA